MNSKAASNDFPIIHFLRDRWSPRAFKDKTVEKEKLQSLFEAARWSPSSSNIQPWRFIIGVKGSDTYEKIFSTMDDFNQLWVRNAPLLLLTMAKKTNLKGEINKHALYDLGQSVAHLTFQATSDGLFVHQMAGFDPGKAATIFEVPDDFLVTTCVAIGYLGDPETLHEKLKKSELKIRERRVASDSVFTDIFGKTTDIFNH